MKDQQIRTLCEGRAVDSVFAISSRELRSARTGDPYLALELADATGRIGAVRFRPTPDDEAVPVGSVVRVRGVVTTFRGVRRITVDSMAVAADRDRCDLMPGGARPRSEMIGELRDAVRGVSSRPLRAVLDLVFGAEGFVEEFATRPAAVGRHHAYVGGLLEHTLSVAATCRALASIHPQVDADLLVTAALLHDVGKVEELSCGPTIEFTEAGRLIGHVVLGERLVARAVEAAGERVPADVAMRLSHALLAHHGEPEWGAARRPCSLEALLLHHADDLDAQVAAFGAATEGAAVLEERWSDRSNPFGRALLVPSAPVAEARRRAPARAGV